MTKTMAALLAAGATFLSIGGIGGHAEAPASTTPAADAKDCTEGQKLIQEYIKVYGIEESFFRPLIVLLPDPVELGNRDAFAAMFAGVEEAAQEPGGQGQTTFVRDRRWLPWPEHEGGADAARCWEREPGVAIYRPSDRNVPALLVLVVGETPTWGVRNRQLVAALSAARTHGCRGPTCQLPILGPTFSGTAASLAATLNENNENQERYTIVSGTASHPTVPVILTTELSSYQTTAPNESQLLKAMDDFLADRGRICEAVPGRKDKRTNVVLFTESSTLYGSLEARECFRAIKFPRGQHGDADALELGELLRELSRSRVRFVGIAATDARDVIALAKRIRAELPDVRLFTLSASLDFLREDNASTLNGMLVAHGASLPMRRAWSTVLESELVRNVFHAGHSLLTHEPVAQADAHVSFVGNGVLWGLDDGQPRRAPMSWRVVTVLAFGAFGAIFIVLCLGRSRIARRPGWRWSIVRPCGYGDLEADDHLTRCALLVVSAAPCGMLLVASDPHWTFAGFAALAALGLVALTYVIFGGTTSHSRSFGTLFLTSVAWVATVLAASLACGSTRSATFYLMSGGSQIFVGLIGLGGFAVALWCSHVRLHMLDTHRFESGRRRFVHFADRSPPIATALDEKDDRSAGLLRAEKNLLETIRDPWKVDSAVILVWGLFAASIAVPWLVKPPLTFEPGWRNLVLVAFGLLATVPAVASFARLLSSWMKLHAFLGLLAGIPAFAALGKLPERLARPLESQLASSVFDDLDLASVVDILDRLAKVLPFLSERRDRCRAYLGSATRHEAEGKIAHRRGRVVSILLTVSGDLHRMKRLDTKTRGVVHELGAALVALFLPRYVRHFRLFVPQLVIGSLASVFMTSLYFVEPQRLMATVIFLWIVALFIALLVVYISLDRDPVMSAISRTPAHKVSFNWALVQRVIGLALLPAASLLSLQHLEFPIWLSRVIDVVGKALR